MHSPSAGAAARRRDAAGAGKLAAAERTARSRGSHTSGAAPSVSVSPTHRQPQRGGERRVVLLSRQTPGIGKTRARRRLRSSLRARRVLPCCGARVPRSWPYRTRLGWASAASSSSIALKSCSRATFCGSAESSDEWLRTSRAECPDLPPPQPSDPETERFLLFAAVAGLMQRASESFPLCLVLDDLQWADGQTAVLLKHVARAVNLRSPLLTSSVHIATSDLHTSASADRGARRSEPVTGGGADRAERPRGRRGGRDDQHRRRSRAQDRDGVVLAAEITAKTAGNPFFVGEILRSLAETDTLLFDEDVGTVAHRPHLADTAATERPRRRQAAGPHGSARKPASCLRWPL